MKKINAPLEIPDLGTKFLTSDIWFVSQDTKFCKSLRPKKYEEMYNGRNIKKYEKKYREELYLHPEDISFVKGHLFNATTIMSPSKILEYRGYTYYYKMTPSQIEKCVFSVTVDGESAIAKGVQGFVGAYKVWNELILNSTEEKADDSITNQIEVIIPFKVKPQYYIPEIKKRTFYHCSFDRFNELSKYSYVTPYKEDAIKFAIPWNKEDLLFKDRQMQEMQRPPSNLSLSSKFNFEDKPMYLYSINGIDTIPAGRNCGKNFPWNRITLKNAIEENRSLKLDKKIKSWKEYIIKPNEDNTQFGA